MSRAPPFPTRRDRSVSSSNSNGPISAPNSTRPLQINRVPSRPTTPSNSSLVSTSPSQRSISNNASGGPSRPQRSELRQVGTRASDYSDRTSSTYRDSVASSSARTEMASNYRPRPMAGSNPNAPSALQTRMQRGRGDTVEDETTSPSSLGNVMSAFREAGTRRRATTEGDQDFEYQKERNKEREAERARAQKITEKAQGRRLNGRARPGDIDAILDQIKDEWEFVIDPDFNTVDLALQLLDESSTGKDMDSFRRTKHMLSKALKGSVDKYYQAFAASLPHHASLLNHLGDTQTQVSEARASLQESKDALGTKRADLVQLWSRGQTLEEMMRILDQIDQLKSMPDLLETLMSEKRLLQASVLLVKNLKVINKPDILEIGAVADLRSYLSGQETALWEILIDELQSHLYLKSFWCDSRWAPYTPNQKSFVRVPFEDEAELKPFSLPPNSPSTPSFHQSRLSRFLNGLAVRPNDPPLDFNEPNFRDSSSGLPSSTLASTFANPLNPRANAISNPESDSFAYMETILESLAVLGRLGSALDVVAQRLPSEIFSLVDSTLDEVSERAEYGQGGSIFTLNNGSGSSDGVYILSADPTLVVTHKNQFLRAATLRLAALESSSQQMDHEVLNDFFWTLYSKMDAVAQGLRVIYEVANRIGSRRDFKDSSGTKPGALFSLDDIWASIRTLIYDYLTSEEEGNIASRNPVTSINEILRDGRFSRDKTKGVFRLADTDQKATKKVLKPHEDALTQVIKDTMPGLVQASTETAIQSALSKVGTDDRLLVGVGQHHRLLIKPNAFHVSVLFQPTLAWLDRIAEVLPTDVANVRASGAVLDEFVLKVYLPQLEEKVSSLFHQAVAGPEAFQTDHLSKRLSPEPLVKASTQLMALVNSLCVMLQTTPFHRESYSRLILGVVIQFYQRCSDRFQDLVTTSPPTESNLTPLVALSAQWAQRQELTAALTELKKNPPLDLSQRQLFCQEETKTELGFLGDAKVSKTDLVPSTRNLAALNTLYRSISWFASELSALKARPEDMPPTPQNLEPLSAMPYTPYTPLLPLASPNTELSLPLSREMALRFQALIRTYDQLSDLILDTVRIDIRCRTLHYLDLAMRLGNYTINSEAGEPDPHIIDLNNELGECDDFITVGVPKAAREFIFMGLGQLMEHVLISSARHLQQPNAFGIKKILRNVLALQQCLKTITHGVQSQELERVKKYYSLFFKGPQDMIEEIRKEQVYTFDEYQVMLALQCGVDPKGGSNRTSQSTDRNYSMYMIDLHGLEIEESGTS
ncbi:sec8 exocyst complex component specific domain-containing protein [Moniliophthora roreri]|uniref:Exocyst complex component Sec8 n=1 Tax=Moniliophthora roreri TaxID=221103 RepID=A0A0W0FGV8_MONRR|nr:sec8 exocyst complex component specific domain-containing protein [Moniliophthora roreri]